MHGSGCATCHGADREGGRLMPQFWIVAPALVSESLFGEGHASFGDHDNHDTYDEASLRNAITQGIDPSGKPLNEAMPRWSMESSDLSDLIEYLKH